MTPEKLAVLRDLRANDVSAIPDHFLLAKLAIDYEPATPPPCPVCGAALVITASDDGGAIYACPQVDTGLKRLADGDTWEGSLAHYSKSRWVAPPGDVLVVELIRRYRDLKMRVRLAAIRIERPR